MRDVGRAVRAGARRLAERRPWLTARLRFFGLLLLLLPLFAGLQRLVTDVDAAAEVRLVPREVPVERIVERVVERIIYQAVPAEASPEPPALPGPRP